MRQIVVTLVSLPSASLLLAELGGVPLLDDPARPLVGVLLTAAGTWLAGISAIWLLFNTLEQALAPERKKQISTWLLRAEPERTVTQWPRAFAARLVIWPRVLDGRYGSVYYRP